MQLQKSEKIFYEAGPKSSILVIWFFTKVLFGTFIFGFLSFWASGFFGGFFIAIFKPDNPENLLSFWQMIPTILPLFVIIAFVYTYYLRKTYRYYVTSQRVAFEGGIILKKTISVPYNKITNIDMTQNIVEQILKIYSLEIQTAGTGIKKAEMFFVGLEDAELPQKLILKALKTYKRVGD